MPKLAKPLSAIEVKQLSKAGLWAVGTVSGLYLNITDSLTKSWILRTKIGNKRSDVGLGAYPATGLADAHRKAQAIKELIQSGINPISERKRQREKVEWTFDRCASEYIELHRPSWKNAKHGDQWANTLATYASPVIGSKHVRDVSVADVLAIIQPIWVGKNETASRVRNRIELVLSWAASRELRSRENPATWRGGLEHALPKKSKVSKAKHHKAVAYRDAHAFMQRLTIMAGVGAKALQFLIYTGARSGEVRGAVWNEIDFELALWTIPEGRMKSGREHRVPLPAQAVELLQSLPRFEPTEGQPDFIFPNSAGGQLSDMTLTALLRRMKVDATAHGFRSTFADWSAERTDFPVELREMALAHTLGDKTREAYQRSDLMERRRALMAQWAAYIHTAPISGTVTQIRGAA